MACRASFKSAAGLKQHYAQCRDCQDSDSDSSVENATLLDPSTLGAPLLTNEGSLQCDTAGSIDQPPADAAGIQVPASTDLDLDAGNGDIFNYSLDIGGDMGEPEPEPEVSDTHKRSALEANTSIPSDPSRIEDLFEEQYPGAGCVISHGMIPFQHISSIPSYNNAKSSNQTSNAYYPFKDLEEVEIVDWLFHNHLSKASINAFVKTKYVSGMLMTTPDLLIRVLQISTQVKGAPLSFKSAYTLHRLLDKLPCAGPVWKSIVLSPKTGTPKEGTPPVLFYHDPIAAV